MNAMQWITGKLLTSKPIDDDNDGSDYNISLLDGTRVRFKKLISDYKIKSIEIEDIHTTQADYYIYSVWDRQSYDIDIHNIFLLKTELLKKMIRFKPYETVKNPDGSEAYIIPIDQLYNWHVAHVNVFEGMLMELCLYPQELIRYNMSPETN